jgi:hypothetical protein
VIVRQTPGYGPQVSSFLMAGGRLSIPFPLSSAPGANPQESAGRLINCFAEPLGKDVGGKVPQVVWRKVPGLSLFAASANSGFRGAILVDNTLYAAWSGKASRYSSAALKPH